jgi:hypothetical protein
MTTNPKKTSKSIKQVPTQFILKSSTERGEQIMMNINKLQSTLMLDKFVDVYLPNDIFDDFRQSQLFRNWQQEAFAYTFYYVISYLYRNCLYSKVIDIDDLGLGAIKKNILNVGSKTFDMIYTKNGLLDQLGYTVTHTDIPIYALLKDDGSLNGFCTYSDFQATTEHKRDIPNNFRFKLPLKALYHVPPKDYLELEKKRKDDIEIDDLLSYTDGHFFDVYSSHKIQIECLIACLSNPKLGYKGFYLYGFYRRQSDRFKGGYNASIEQIQNIIPISTKTLYQYHVELEKMNLITKTVIPHKPNTYKASSHVPTIEV